MWLNRRRAAQARLKALKEAEASVRALAYAEVKFQEFVDNVGRNLETATFDDRRLALEALEVKVCADVDHAEVKASDRAKLIAIERTSGCLPFHAYMATPHRRPGGTYLTPGLARRG